MRFFCGTITFYSELSGLSGWSGFTFGKETLGGSLNTGLLLLGNLGVRVPKC